LSIKLVNFACSSNVACPSIAGHRHRGN
jgi:hypothetical protein